MTHPEQVLHICPDCGAENTSENNPTVADDLMIRCIDCGEVFYPDD